MSTATQTELFPQSFLRMVAGLAGRIAAQSSREGDRVARRRAIHGSHEFSGHAPYVQGDDPRQIDWPAYARTGRLTVRQYLPAMGDVLTLIPDFSRSMLPGDPPKWLDAARIAAAAGVLALRSGASVQLAIGAGASSFRGPGHVTRLLSAVDSAVASSGLFDDVTTPGDFATGLPRLVDAMGPGRALVIMDALEPPETLALMGGKTPPPAVIALCALEERSPSAGTLRLADLESGRTLELNAGSQLVAAYQFELSAHFERLQSVAGRLRLPLAIRNTGEPIETLFTGFLRQTGVVTWT